MSNLIKDIDYVSQQNDSCEVKTSKEEASGKNKTFYIESYGCQMNFSDSEVVTSILKNEGYESTGEPDDADVVLINTCSIREKAEQTVRKRLARFNKAKEEKPEMKIGVLGCMAERLKSKFLEEEKIVDLVAGPDAYRDLPKLVNEAADGQKAVNTFLSREETYADISPVRLKSNGVSAFISIMRGCDNMCSFCVVPFTRGRERSRNPHSIVEEAQNLFNRGFREVTLLGQNVDSYLWSPEDLKGKQQILKHGDKSKTVNFAQLLAMVADISPELRVRFSTSHPQDITDEVLYTIRDYENICNYIHLPAQCGSNRILDMMNRTYTREEYLERVDAIRRIVGEECGISSDIIAGFCNETEEEHQQTLSLMKEVKYHFSYMFAYSERPGTLAAKRYEDDIPEEVKKRRLQEIINLQQEHSHERNLRAINKTHTILIEGESKKSKDYWKGRNSENTVVIIPKMHFQPGDYVNARVYDCTPATLFGEPV